MEKNDNPIFGRKIFFVTPPLNIENNIVQGLRELEYEVYIIKDYKCAKAILKENQDALCFMFIDTALTYEQWYKFVKSFELDDVLKTVFIGLLSQYISERKKNFFLLNTNLPGGFVMVDVPLDVLFTQIQQILDVNGAKGRRQFIRLECSKNKEISAYMASGSRLFSLEINNISTSGIAMEGSAELANVFVKNATINNISLTIGRRTFVMVGIVFDCRVTGNKCTVVMLLKNFRLEEKAIIRNFIFSNLDEKMNSSIETCLKDMTNYEEYELPKEFAPFGSLSDSYEPAAENSFRKQIEDDISGVEELESI